MTSNKTQDECISLVFCLFCFGKTMASNGRSEIKSLKIVSNIFKCNEMLHTTQVKILSTVIWTISSFVWFENGIFQVHRTISTHFTIKTWNANNSRQTEWSNKHKQAIISYLFQCEIRNIKCFHLTVMWKCRAMQM